MKKDVLTRAQFSLLREVMTTLAAETDKIKDYQISCDVVYMLHRLHLACFPEEMAISKNELEKFCDKCDLKLHEP